VVVEVRTLDSQGGRTGLRAADLVTGLRPPDARRGARSHVTLRRPSGARADQDDADRGRRGVARRRQAGNRAHALGATYKPSAVRSYEEALQAKLLTALGAPPPLRPRPQRHPGLGRSPGRRQPCPEQFGNTVLPLRRSTAAPAAPRSRSTRPSGSRYRRPAAAPPRRCGDRHPPRGDCALWASAL
jgi:hypothetical protein